MHFPTIIVGSAFIHLLPSLFKWRDDLAQNQMEQAGGKTGRKDASIIFHREKFHSMLIIVHIMICPFALAVRSVWFAVIWPYAVWPFLERAIQAKVTLPVTPFFNWHKLYTSARAVHQHILAEHAHTNATCQNGGRKESSERVRERAKLPDLIAKLSLCGFLFF